MVNISSKITPLLSYIARIFDKYSKFALVLHGVIIFYSIVMSFSVSYSISSKLGQNDFAFFFHHIAYVILGIAVIIGMLTVPWNILKYLCLVGYVVTLVLLLLVPIFGDSIKGAQRWIVIFGFSIQPSTFLKVFSIFKTAFILSSKLGSKSLYVLLGLFIIESSLLFVEPDFGSIIIVTLCFGLQVFCSKVNFKFILGIIAAALCGILISVLTLEHVQQRILQFGTQDKPYQVQKSLEAIHSGGIFGIGLGQSNLKYTLPESHNDFIFSIIAEETGILSALAICIAYFLLWLYYIRHSFYKILFNDDAKAFFTFQVCLGCASLMLIEALMHISVNIGLIPPTGVVLPMISYGGSAMLSYGIVVGSLLRITSQSNKHWI